MERLRLRAVALEVVILAVLLTLATTPFIGAVGHPDHIVFGMDLTQHYSREMVNRRAFQQTWVPLWNPYEFSGFPAQADPQVGVFYPPSVVLRLFSVPTFLTLTVVFHVWMVGVGGYALCRVLGVRRLPSVMGAVALMLSGATLGRVYAGHLDVLRAFGWAPLALAAAIQSTDRESMIPSAFAVVALSLQVLAFYPQLIVYTVGAIALYTAFSMLWPKAGARSWRNSWRLATHFLLLVGLVGGLTTFQNLPTSRLVGAAGRTHGLSYESATDDAVPIRDFVNVVFTPDRSSSVPNESWETSAYVGWLPAVLAPLALLVSKQRRLVVFFCLLGGLALALATGGPLYRLHYAIFPMFRIPGRLMGFWAIAVAVLGTIALDGLTAGPPRALARLWPVAIVVPLIAGSVVAVDLLSYAHRFVRIELVRDRFLSSLPFTPTPHGRVLSLCEDRAQTSDLTALGIPSADGYNSYFFWDYAHLAERALGEPASTSLERGFPRFSMGTLAVPAVLNALDVTEIISCDPLPFPGLQLLREDRHDYLYRNTQAAGRASARCGDDHGSPSELSSTCNDGVGVEVLAADTPRGLLRLRVSVPSPRTLMLAEPYYPERRAWVDDVEAPVEKADIALSAVHVDGGSHVVELRYVPTSLRVGAIISATVLMMWAAILWRRDRIPGNAH